MNCGSRWWRKRAQPPKPRRSRSATGSCTCTLTGSLTSWDSGSCCGPLSDCWTSCGLASEFRRPGRWDRGGSELGFGSLPHIALLALALFSRQSDPLLALLRRGFNGGLPLSLLRIPIGVGGGLFPGPADPLLPLAHGILLPLVALNFALGLIL